MWDNRFASVRAVRLTSFLVILPTFKPGKSALSVLGVLALGHVSVSVFIGDTNCWLIILICGGNVQARGFPTQLNDYDDSDKTPYYLLHCGVAKM